MAMPKNLVFVRHGQSEANIVQKQDDHGLSNALAAEIHARPDWQHRLTDEGIEQAKNAGSWLRHNLGEIAVYFDGLYLSPFVRTRETAAYLGGNALSGWTVDDRLVERSWGVYGKMPRAEQRAQFPMTADEKRKNPWYVRLDGGESMPDVYDRFRDFQGTLHREQADRNVLIVSHGDFINAARYGIERMLPEEWEELDTNQSYVLKNCTVLHYSRQNPDDPTDVRDKIRWRRYIYPDNPAESPDDGAWVELSERRRYTGSDLLKQAAASPRLVNDKIVAVENQSNNRTY